MRALILLGGIVAGAWGTTLAVAKLEAMWRDTICRLLKL